MDYEQLFYGDYAIINHDGTEGYLRLISRSVTNNKEKQLILRTLEARKKLIHPKLISLKFFTTEHMSSLKSNCFFIRSGYEYYKNNLFIEIKRRAMKLSYFTPLQLLRLLFDMISVLAFLQKNEICHGELHPVLISLIYDAQRGVYRAKLCERLTGSDDSVFNNMATFKDRHKLFLDPDLFKFIMNPETHKIQTDRYR